MTLTEQDKAELDAIAHQVPDWQKHLEQFREKHPELSPQDVMRKAGFTRRMFVGKLVTKLVRKKLKEIIEKEGGSS